MNGINVYVWIIVMALATGATRILPLTLIRKPIENKFIQSFLYYVPYVTLAVMTFPAIVDSAGSTVAGILALVCGFAAAFWGCNMVTVAVICSAVTFLANLLFM